MSVSWRIETGDCVERMREMPDGGVQCVVTSPPYFGLRDYGVEGQIGLERTPEEFVARLVGVFREVRRVLRDDGTLWLNIGDSYNNRSVARPSSHQGGLGFENESIARSWADQTKLGLSRLSFSHDGLKEKDLIGIPWLLAFALRADGWYLRSDIIWCLSGGARVYARTQKGDMPMAVKDLVRLDPATVKLWNGERWTQALGWSRSPDPRDGALEIELRSGERIGCTLGHKWPTARGNVRADELLIGDVIVTTTLPEPDEPDTPSALDDARVGWMAGRYLADGSTSEDTVQIACHADERQELEIVTRDFARSFHGTAVAYRTVGNSATVNVNGPLSAAVIRAYVHGSTAGTKGIEPRAWRRSNVFLRALLDGYLSGDAHYDAANDRWRLGFTRNDRLADDLRTLAARLGCTLTLRPTTATGFGKTWPVYRGELRFGRTGHHNEKHRSEVVAIRRSRARQFWDIGVADDPHLFALASGVLTHNSKPNPMPESVRDRPTSAHEHVFLLSKGPRYFYDADAIREPDSGQDHRRRVLDGQASLEPTGGRMPPHSGLRCQEGRDGRGRNKRNVWEIATQPYAEAHFATFPAALVEPCVLAGSSPRACGECGAPWRRVTETRYENPGNRTTNGPRSIARRHLEHGSAGFAQRLERRSETVGWEPSCEHEDDSGRCIVLDPFAGSGTVGVVCEWHGRDFVGVELDPAYAEMARTRIGAEGPLGRRARRSSVVPEQASLLDEIERCG